MINMNEELEEFYKDHEDDKHQKNFRLLIDEWDSLSLLLPNFETFNIKPILNKEQGLIEIDIKKSLKKSDNNNNKLF